MLNRNKLFGIKSSLSLVLKEIVLSYEERR